MEYIYIYLCIEKVNSELSYLNFYAKIDIDKDPIVKKNCM